MGPSRPTEGFTLIELMVVIVIIAVIAGAAAPAIGNGVRDRKHAQAALDIVRAFRVARSSAAGFGRAYVVRFDAEGDGGRGTLVVARGNTNRCNSVTTWTDVRTEYQTSRFAPDFLLETRTSEEYLELCYEPTGVASWRTGTSGRFTTASPQVGGANVGGFRFTIDRKVNGAIEGVQRQVVVPLGGDARVGR